jgi:sigma-E factor negative regulatory protein RseA
MSEEQRRRLSALVDGEHAGDDPEVLTDLALGDEALRGVWERYHLIGQALRGESIDPGVRATATAVRRVLATEPVDLEGRRRARFSPPHVAPIAGAALAAAAVLVAVVAAPALFQIDEDGPPLVPAPLVSSAVFPPGNTAQMRPWRMQTPELASKLDLLLVNHQEAVPGSGVKGMLLYATLVSHGTGR